MAKWFTLLDDKIEGPFSTEQLVRRAEAGELGENHLIWGALQNAWKPVSWWQKSIPHFKSLESEMNQPEAWYMVQGGRKTGPLSRQEVVLRLKQIVAANEPVNKSLLWTKGLKKWAAITEFHDLMNEVGLDKREHPRAAITGQVVVHFQGQTFLTALKSISEGGLGIEPVPMVLPGEEIQVEIESKHFGGTIKAKAEVRYSTTLSMGLKFASISTEKKSEIVTYVKKYLKLDSGAQAA